MGLCLPLRVGGGACPTTDMKRLCKRNVLLSSGSFLSSEDVERGPVMSVTVGHSTNLTHYPQAYSADMEEKSTQLDQSCGLQVSAPGSKQLG